MSKKQNIAKRALFMLLAIAIGFAIGTFVTRRSSERIFTSMLSSRAAMYNKLNASFALIDNYYVDSLSTDSLAEKLMPKLFEQLDPHSTYIPAKSFSKMNESLDGEFDGIGVVFNMATDTVIVLNVIASGPSAKAGILARDRIITIDADTMAGKKIRQDSIVSRLRGKRGTKVMLGIERKGVDGLVDIEVTRGKIPVHSVGATLMIEEGVGYISIYQFSRNTYSEFVDAINKLLPQGLKSLILDLRGNSGGFMDQAILLSNEFLPNRSLIVYTEDREGRQIREYCNRDGQLQNMELIVLVDEGSASSSEIVAGALQDNDRGTIIGRRTFGKGLVQKQIPFNDGSAIRLTTARYYTPTGRSIQKPYAMGKGEDYEHEILDRIKHEELFTADSIAFADSLKFITPKGKVVYGGGGIMPDIFVPIDRDTLPNYFVEVAGKNILYRYTIEYSDRNRAKLAAVESLQDLEELFAADKNLVSDFVAYAKKSGIKGSAKEIKESKYLIEAQLKAHIGRNTKLEENGYIINIYPLDDVLQKALEVINE